MKKTFILSVSLVVCVFSGGLFAQEKKSNTIKKEVRMEDDHGVKTLTITTTENETTSEIKYFGEEAESKMAELMEGKPKTEEVTKEVEVDEVNGQKRVTVTTSTNGKMREEIYTGEDAERIISEMESNSSDKKGVKKKTLIETKMKTDKREVNK